MICRASTLCDKEVINISDGSRLGKVDDVEVDLDNARICSVIVYGKYRFFGLLGRSDDLVIRWNDITLIGEDTVLVSFKEAPRGPKKKKGFLSGIFG